MNRRVAMIKDGVVWNIAVWDGTSNWNPGSVFKLVDVTDQPRCDIGWVDSGGELSPPVPSDQDEGDPA